MTSAAATPTEPRPDRGRGSYYHPAVMHGEKVRFSCSACVACTSLRRARGAGSRQQAAQGKGAFRRPICGSEHPIVPNRISVGRSKIRRVRRMSIVTPSRRSRNRQGSARLFQEGVSGRGGELPALGELLKLLLSPFGASCCPKHPAWACFEHADLLPPFHRPSTTFPLQLRRGNCPNDFLLCAAILNTSECGDLNIARHRVRARGEFCPWRRSRILRLPALRIAREGGSGLPLSCRSPPAG